MAPRITRSEQSVQKPTASYPTSPFRLFEDFFNDWVARSVEGRRSETWTPPVDLLEREGNLLLRIELPGMNEQDIEIKVEGLVLTVKGERRTQESEGYTYRQVESFYGAFSRSFTLPDSADLEDVKANYKNGLLTVTIPQKTEVRPRSIKVTT